MFLLFAFAAMLGGAVQTSFMARYYRSLPVLSTLGVRGVTLGVTMLPILALTGPVSPSGTDILMLIGSAAITVAGNICAALAMRYLDISTGTALQTGSLTLGMTLIGVLYFEEHLTLAQTTGIGLILSSLVLLSRSKSATAPNPRALLGAGFSILYGFFLAFGFSLLTAVTRATDPFAAAYFWETTIGLISLGASFAARQPLPPAKTMGGIMLAASPTAIGTGCYAYASTLGPIAVIAAVLSTMVLATAALGWLLYGERLTKIQAIALGLSILGVCALKLA